MPRLPFVAACALTVACAAGGPRASAEELRSAVPGRDLLSMAMVETVPLSAPVCPATGAAVFGGLAHDAAGTVDALLAGVLGLVDEVSAQLPAAEEPGQAMWGPLVGATSVYTLAVQEVDAGSYRYFLGGEAPGAGDAWEGVFGGTTVGDDPLHRSGVVQVDFGVMHARDPSVDPVAGGAEVHFAVDGPAREVTAYLGGIVGRDGSGPDDRQVAWSVAADQTVGLAFATHVDGAGGVDEVVQIDARWAPDGRGTAHVAVAGGAPAQAVECWDAALGRVYYADDRDPGASEGAVGCCPF